MNEKKIIKIFIADRHTLFRTGTKNAVKDSNIEVVGEAGNKKDLIPGLLKCCPDLLVTAHYLYNDDAINFLPEVKDSFPDLKILMLTMCCNKEGLLKYINHIDGFICKSATSELIVTTIKSLANGGYYYFIP